MLQVSDYPSFENRTSLAGHMERVVTCKFDSSGRHEQTFNTCAVCSHRHCCIQKERFAVWCSCSWNCVQHLLLRHHSKSFAVFGLLQLLASLVDIMLQPVLV